MRRLESVNSLAFLVITVRGGGKLMLSKHLKVREVCHRQGLDPRGEAQGIQVTPEVCLAKARSWPLNIN